MRLHNVFSMQFEPSSLRCGFYCNLIFASCQIRRVDEQIQFAFRDIELNHITVIHECQRTADCCLR